MDFWIKAAQLVTSLSILIVLHELGHFIPARLFKTRVEKFYLFFNPWFELFKIKKGETEYGLGWLPLGGYVKIAGMIDESMDKEQMAKPAQPWEFRSKPAWQRLIIMVGGVTVNLLLGIFIYAMVLFVWGEDRLPMAELKDGVMCANPLAEELGFRHGDKILAFDGNVVEYFDEITALMIYAKEATVERNGQLEKISIPENIVEQLGESGSKTLFYPRVPFVVGAIAPDSPNSDVDLKANDKLVMLDSTAIQYNDQGRAYVRERKGSKVMARFERDGTLVNTELTVSDSGLLGLELVIPRMSEMKAAGTFKFDIKEYSFFASFPAGLGKAWDRLTGYVQQFKLIFNPKTGAYKSLGGFAAIGSLFSSGWDWQWFWELTAILSLILAFMNILPIPALDGGHVVFLLYEMITGRVPNPKVLEKAQMVGMILLLALLVFANGNDIYRFIFK